MADFGSLAPDGMPPWVAEDNDQVAAQAAADAAALRQRRSVMGARPFGALAPAATGERKEGGATRFLDSLGTSVYNAAARPSRMVNRLMEPDYNPADPNPDPGLADNAAALSVDLIGGPGLVGAVPERAAGIFGGRLAQTADHAALGRAEDMARKGADRDAIWNDTGWFQGSDGKWRFEIDDSNAALNPHTFGEAIPAEGSSGRIAGLMWHRPFFNAYPEARRADMSVRPGESSGAYYANPSSPTIEVQAPTVSDGRSIALHEMQHDVQSREGFAHGGGLTSYFDHDAPELEPLRRTKANLERAYADEWAKPNPDDGRLRRIQSDMMDLEPTMERAAGLAGYRRLAGEVESRNVQTRRDMTPEQRRAEAPWKTQDIPDDQQIVRFGSLAPQESRASGFSSNDDFKAYIQNLRSEIEGHEKRISAAAESGGFRSSDGRELLSKNTGPNAETSPWRITYFDQGQPTGHYEGGRELFRELAGRERLFAKKNGGGQ